MRQNKQNERKKVWGRERTKTPQKKGQNVKKLSRRQKQRWDHRSVIFTGGALLLVSLRSDLPQRALRPSAEAFGGRPTNSARVKVFLMILADTATPLHPIYPACSHSLYFYFSVGRLRSSCLLLFWWEGEVGRLDGGGGGRLLLLLFGADGIEDDEDDDGGVVLLLWLLSSFTRCVVYCLHVPIDRRDVVAGEHARLAVAAPFPPVGVGVVQNLDEVSASEAQLSFLLGVEVKERLHVRGMLGGREEGALARVSCDDQMTIYNTHTHTLYMCDRKTIEIFNFYRTF